MSVPNIEIRAAAIQAHKYLARNSADIASGLQASLMHALWDVEDMHPALRRGAVELRQIMADRLRPHDVYDELDWLLYHAPERANVKKWRQINKQCGGDRQIYDPSEEHQHRLNVRFELSQAFRHAWLVALADEFAG